MTWEELSNKSIALLGAGKENLSLIRLFSRYTQKIALLDRFSLPEEISQSLARDYPFLKVVTGENYLDNLGFDFLFRSPGMPLHTVRSKLINQPSAKLLSATSLFLELAPTRKIIGVTGTKGKGTTSIMIYSICRHKTKNCFLAGNIGRSIFDHWEQLNSESLVVMEMSSFQLEDLTISPSIAVILPIEPDHLEPLSEISPNFHASFDDYLAAKANITLHQKRDDYLIYAFDNLPCQKIAALSKAKKIPVGFNSGARYFIEPDGLLNTPRTQYQLGRCKLVGQHLFLDAALAVAVGECLNIDSEVIEKGLTSFNPLPHRFERFYQSKGVEFINDSYATSPSSAIYAIESLDKPIHWIGGGSRKGADFSELAKVIARSKLVSANLIGEEAGRLMEALIKGGVASDKIKQFSSLEDAVLSCLKDANEGDVVLLSPACASKDMFKDAAERGDRFKKIVNESGF